MKLKIVILGLTISSSWGNGHATVYRGLVKALNKLGHKVTFLERKVYWYYDTRDLSNPDYCKIEYYNSVDELSEKYLSKIIHADLVIIGSYVPEGTRVGELVNNYARGIKCFYDIDTPVTLQKLNNRDFEYITPDLIPKFDIYLSCADGPILKVLTHKYNSPMAKVLLCSVDHQIYFPKNLEKKWLLGYIGTYSKDRQPKLEQLMFKVAAKMPYQRFVVAGSLYPSNIKWPKNIDYITHISPQQHVDFYNSQCFTLNISRKPMLLSGYSPSVRIFEAASCGVPIISDYWDGIEDFLKINEEILISKSFNDILIYLKKIPESIRKKIGLKARSKILSHHTSFHRALQFEGYLKEILK